jgi:hypothetical protein
MDLRPRNIKGSVTVRQAMMINQGETHTVRDNHRGPLADCLLSDPDGKVIGEEDPRGHHLGRAVVQRRLGVFQEEADVVPASVGELLGVSGGSVTVLQGNREPLQRPHCGDHLLGKGRGRHGFDVEGGHEALESTEVPGRGGKPSSFCTGDSGEERGHAHGQE